eukprot:498579-Pleurochrysis_carterae.AAC.2
MASMRAKEAGRGWRKRRHWCRRWHATAVESCKAVRCERRAKRRWHRRQHRHHAHAEVGLRLHVDRASAAASVISVRQYSLPVAGYIH